MIKCDDVWLYVVYGVVKLEVSLFYGWIGGVRCELRVDVVVFWE